MKTLFEMLRNLLVIGIAMAIFLGATWLIVGGIIAGIFMGAALLQSVLAIVTGKAKPLISGGVLCVCGFMLGLPILVSIMWYRMGLWQFKNPFL